MVEDNGNTPAEQPVARVRSGRRTAVTVTAVVAVLAVGVAVVRGVHGTAAGDPTAASASAAEAAAQPDRVRSDLDGIVREVTEHYGAEIGVSVRAAGTVVHVGTLDEVRAWSTMKVPVAVAAVRRATAGKRLPLLRDDLTYALTMSDNDAAMRLWTSLGTWRQSSVALTRVLHEARDPTDAVAAENAADYTGFGDIHWSLGSQVTFADRLACLRGSAPVLDGMGQVVPVQRMGLGALPGSRFKGGWGPEPDGTYLLREFGLVGPAGRQVPVAYAVVPDAGSDTTARKAAEALAEALAPVVDRVSGHGGAAECQVPDSVPAASTAAPVSAADYLAGLTGDGSVSKSAGDDGDDGHTGTSGHTGHTGGTGRAGKEE